MFFVNKVFSKEYKGNIDSRYGYKYNDCMIEKAQENGILLTHI